MGAKKFGGAAAPGMPKRAAEAFTMIGVVGAAISILAVVDEVAPLAPWAQVAIELWQTASTLFWRFVSRLLDLAVEKWLVSVLTFSAFIVFTSVGVRLASQAPRLSVLGVLGRFLFLAVVAVVVSGVVTALFAGALGLAPGRDQTATLVTLAVIYAPLVSLVVWLTRRNRGESAFYSWATIALSSGVALLFALSILANSSLSEDVRLLLFTLVFGVLSGFAIAAPLLIAPHRDLFHRYAAIYGVVGIALLLSGASQVAETLGR